MRSRSWQEKDLDDTRLGMKHTWMALAFGCSLFACGGETPPAQDPSTSSATTTPNTPAADPAPAPVTSAAPTTTPEPAPAPAPEPTKVTTAKPLKEQITGATMVKVTVGHTGEKTKPKEVTIKNQKDVDALIAAVGSDQTPTDSRPKCMPNAELDFQDASGKSLGKLSAFCGDGEVLTTAGYTDADGKGHGLTLSDAKALQDILKKAGAPVKIAGATPAGGGATSGTEKKPATTAKK